MEDARAITEILQRLARIETKLDGYQQVRDTVTELRSGVADHERRIINIEGWGKWLVAGVGILVIQELVKLVVR